MEVRGDILQKRTITHETSGVDVTSDVEHIGPRVVHIQIGTHVEIVDGCGVGNTNLSCRHERGGSIKLHGIGGDVSISGNLVKVRGDVFQKGTVADEPGGVDVTGDMEHIGSLVVHIQIGTHIEVVHRCRIGDTDTRSCDDVFYHGIVTDEPGGVDVTSDVENVGPRVVHVQIGTYI